ncbi:MULTISPECIES: HNH endonuclease [Mycobacterium avium complex (MAC)]|uniref:HNH endonuclease n=1 Tax=Mycobacterium intracellulare subsp. chimaera TaxID=222805 RepID=A0ABT7P654_MYCIT|nr:MULTISPECIES: HNH endonuclease [Mycobacterium avium complex (MAC)]AOS95102.2 restriction endonuclease [Mycobacterium intracellulare subsp. chimaera]MDM3928739.1 HNH endonuclease [Mycobacterium intracellulare subsp. chimaera]
MLIPMPDLTVEVYNADYRTLAHITWQHAVQLILRGAVVVIDVHNPAVHIHGPSLVIELPLSVALREYVHIPYRADTKVTREGVLRRDRNTCVYCGRRAQTIDHVLPKSRGGADHWINLVAACHSCNGRKDNRTPEEAGMTMIREPFEPKDRDRFRRAPVPVPV